jgi:hypothetical protein
VLAFEGATSRVAAVAAERRAVRANGTRERARKFRRRERAVSRPRIARALRGPAGSGAWRPLDAAALREAVHVFRIALHPIRR